MRVFTEPDLPKTAWDKTRAFFQKVYTWILGYPVALFVAVGGVLLMVVLLALGLGDRFDLGGFLSRWSPGRKEPEDRVIVANKVPPKRQDSEDRTIPIGEPDEFGMVQRPVEILDERKNPFRDKSKLEVKDSSGEKRKIQLPKGVKDKEVDQVLELNPGTFKIIVKDRPEGRISQEDLKWLE